MASIFAGRYEIIKKIGHGGMADVYLAKDTILEREVAIKILRGELSKDPVSLLRFKREAEAISHLSHVNIVKIFDVGEAEGMFFIVMEYVKGNTLKQLVYNRGALYKEEAVSIMKQIVNAIASANQKGVIHRDIKPQNILVKDDGTIKITDFGIASTQDAMQLTQQDSVLGSVHYLAPELSRGESATEQSDVYALGIVFYELLTGDVPFKGKNAVEVAMMHIRDELPSVRDFNPSLPQAVENIILKATVKNRQQRYATAKEMYEDLSTCLSEARSNEKKFEVNKVKENKLEKTLVMNSKINKPKKWYEDPRAKIGIGVAGGILVLMFLIILINVFGSSNRIQQVMVPDVSRKSIVEAQELLESEGFKVDLSYEFVVTEDIDKDLVVSTVPQALSEIDQGSLIKLVVSKGKFIVIEDYTGKTLAEVQEIFKDSSINLVINREVNTDVEVGKIIRQSGLTIGDKLDPTIRRELQIVVSKELEVMIPYDLLGKSVASAKAELEALGVTVEVIHISVSELTVDEKGRYQPNTVIRSTPLPGIYYVQKTDTMVELFYSTEELVVEEPEG